MLKDIAEEKKKKEQVRQPAVPVNIPIQTIEEVEEVSDEEDPAEEAKEVLHSD